MSVEKISECLEQSEASLDSVEELVHPCGEGEWRLIVDDKYSNPTADDCPSGWEEFIETTTSRRFCSKRQTTPESCKSAFFPVSGNEYSKVCGTIVGYAHGTHTAFRNGRNSTIDDEFHVNGISVTHGDPRQHIWTFAIGAYESARHLVGFDDFLCPCHPDFSGIFNIPVFIGDDYFCESGLNGEDSFSLFFQAQSDIYFLDDPLWNGRQCFGDCCFGSPFVKTLDNGPTTDPLEIRICNVPLSEAFGGNILVENVKIYVQ